MPRPKPADCPICGKHCTTRGVNRHIKAKHPQPTNPVESSAMPDNIIRWLNKIDHQILEIQNGMVAVRKLLG